MRNVDSVLLPFLHSMDESERDRLLGELLLAHAAPIIRRALKQRLSFYVSRLGTNPDNPDAEDLYSKVIAEIVKRLRELQSDPGEKVIERFDQYVHRVAVNICNNYLRSKAPRRYHLKSNLRLRFEDENVDDLWSMLLDAGICAPLQLAEEFGLTLGELTALWARIPMSNADIAAYLGVRKQQVSQWRSRGWNKLRHLIGERAKK